MAENRNLTRLERALVDVATSAIERTTGDAPYSRQPRFEEGDNWGGVWHALPTRYLNDSEVPPRRADNRARDAWLREAWQ